MTTTRFIHEEESPWFEEARLNLEMGCSASGTILEDHWLQQDQEEEGTQLHQFGFSSNSIGPSMFPVNPSGVQRGNKRMVTTGVETSQKTFWSSSRSTHQEQLFRWPFSFTKAARNKRTLARRMASSGSSSSSSPSLWSSHLASRNGKKAVPATANVEGSNKILRFLFQKILKNSDVRSPGRIVIPKKDAEARLPNLSVKEGIEIAVRDVSTTRVWFMKYRFWPNNHSRMYVLEKTWEFLQQNGLQAGDSIMMYDEDESKELFILGKKADPRPDARQPLCYSPLLVQQVVQQNQQQIQLQQFYSIQAQSSGSSTVGDCSLYDDADAAPLAFEPTSASNAIAIDSHSTAHSLPLALAAAVEEPSLYNDATITVGHDKQEVMGSSGSNFTNFNDRLICDLNLLPRAEEPSLYNDATITLGQDVQEEVMGSSSSNFTNLSDRVICDLNLLPKVEEPSLYNDDSITIRQDIHEEVMASSSLNFTNLSDRVICGFNLLPGVEEPSLYNDATITVRQDTEEEVMGSSTSNFTNLSVRGIRELNLLLNFGSLNDNDLAK